MDHLRRFPIKGTLLSRSPREESRLVAVAGVMLVLFVSLLCWRDPQTFRLLAASPAGVLESGEYWRLLTAVGVHADFRHFFSNAIFFSFFSYLLYGYFGFWIYPVAVLVLGALTNYFSLLTYPPEVRLVGASGVVYLMEGFWLTLYVLIERSRSLRKRLLRAVGVGLIVLIPTSLSPEVSYRTHAIGFAIGVLAAAAYFQLKKKEIRALEVVDWELPEEECREEGDPWIH